ncbi:AfsR/SARP family transcriptional regulator [Cryptosporangium arvum]|uniref:DNA-binding transcriptional activator of the SARP family n=1 Tax=Cryptosporangium arvum DSM 44712 TaxID=927661 RepID=A0A010YR59_9ACTN|nr:AfsR/SARP family transcriptional regulator [Cryptosporangium arvum]EXG82680.1 DNA-binding transcriptional activator of the SARP family [Cryptosporangium arvum DSM 44712]
MILRCRCLGSLEVHGGDQWRPVRGARARALLAVLVRHRGEHVPARRLADEVWDGRPPASAGTLIRGYVSALRRAFGADGARVIVGSGGGYRLDLPPDAVDVDLFDALCAQGGTALRRGDPEGAALLLADALALHRGPACADVPRTRTLTAFAEGVEERRLVAVEARIEAELACSRHTEVLGELRRLVTEHPNRERLLAQWMRALHAAGRRAEALDVYLAAHKRLVEQRGIDPGPELRAAHRTILAAEDAPRPQARPGRGGTGWSPPSQAPAGIADFTGRDAELARCLAVLTEPGARALRVVAISGRAGVGKSALAVTLTHGLRAWYPDGQLYADLTGETHRAVEPADVLAMFLRAVGVPGSAVPERTDERAALLRSIVADRRVLVVLENAPDERRIRALLPGGAGCAVLVTSRGRLSALEGAHFVELDVFTPEEALTLLERVVGADRVHERIDAARRLLDLCGRLPLAVRIMAARIASAPRTPLEWFAERLADERRRLDELRLHDLDVRAGIGAGYALLSSRQRRVLRRLAVLDVTAFPAWVVALVADVDERAADEALDALVGHRLLDAAGPDDGGRPRYRFHGLVRLFARERAAADPDLDPAAVLECAVRGWRALAEQATTRLPARTLAPIPSPARPGPVTDEAIREPFAWFDAERESIAELVGQSVELGRADLAWPLAAAAHPYYELRDYSEEGSRVHRSALDACRAAGDSLGEAVMSRNLADLYISKPGSDISEKLAHAERALELFRAAGHAPGEADAGYLAATVHRVLGATDQVEACLDASLAVAGSVGYRLGEVHVWQLRGILRRQQGRQADAIAAAGRALTVARELGSSRDVSVLLGLIGLAHRDRGEPGPAEAALAEAVTIAEETGDPVQLAFLCAHLGGLYVESGDPRAQRLLDRGLALSTGSRSEFGEAMALDGLGRLALRSGAPRRAVAHFTDAVALHRRAGNLQAEAKALAGLASAWLGAGDPVAARDTGLTARALFRRLGNETEAGLLSVVIGPQPRADSVENA